MKTERRTGPLPRAALRASINTRIALFESLESPGSHVEVRKRFIEYLKTKKVPFPSYPNRETTWSEFLQEAIQAGYVANNGSLQLTENGQGKLQSLRLSLRHT